MTKKTTKWLKYIPRITKSNVSHRKQSYWVDNYNFEPSFELATNPELIAYVNSTFLGLLDDKENLCETKCKKLGFKYDENIVDSFEFYMTNQKDLECRYFMEV